MFARASQDRDHDSDDHGDGMDGHVHGMDAHPCHHGDGMDGPSMPSWRWHGWADDHGDGMDGHVQIMTAFGKVVPFAPLSYRNRTCLGRSLRVRVDLWQHCHTVTPVSMARRPPHDRVPQAQRRARRASRRPPAVAPASPVASACVSRSRRSRPSGRGVTAIPVVTAVRSREYEPTATGPASRPWPLRAPAGHGRLAGGRAGPAEQPRILRQSESRVSLSHVPVSI